MNTSGIRKESYLVEGMSCAGCERAIQKAVGNLQGVQNVKADLASSSVSFEYDSSSVTIDEIKATVNKLGYRIAGERPAYGQKDGRDDAVS